MKTREGQTAFLDYYYLYYYGPFTTVVATVVRLVPNQSENGKYNLISVGFI